MAPIPPWWGRTAWFRLLNGVLALRLAALGFPPGSPMITANAAWRNRPGCVWCDHASHSWSRASGWVSAPLHSLHELIKHKIGFENSQRMLIKVVCISVFPSCRKERSASVLPDSPSPWSSRSPAAPPPSPTGQSSAASAWTAAAAPPTEPPPCPWSSNAPTDRSWRSTWCSSSPAPATTTAPGRTTSSSPCTTRRWWETWREPLKDDRSLWLENKNRTPSHFAAQYICLCFYFVNFSLLK